MKSKLLTVAVLVLACSSALAQARTYDAPGERYRAVVVPVGERGYENYESRIEIRTSGGRLLRLKSYASPDHNHGEGVNHAEWSPDGQFFIFNTFSSGGHQPWHVNTYFYSLKSNRFYSLDAFIGPVTSDFRLEGRNTILTTRFKFGKRGDEEPVKVVLRHLRLS